jgi:hypothetical protein
MPSDAATGQRALTPDLHKPGDSLNRLRTLPVQSKERCDFGTCYLPLQVALRGSATGRVGQAAQPMLWKPESEVKKTERKARLSP